MYRQAVYNLMTQVKIVSRTQSQEVSQKEVEEVEGWAQEGMKVVE